jgi:hypothetical protein
MNIPLTVNLRQLLTDTLDLFPGDEIPAEATEQMHKVVMQQAILTGLIGSIQSMLGPAIAKARKGDNEALDRVYDLLMNIDASRD